MPTICDLLNIDVWKIDGISLAYPKKHLEFRKGKAAFLTIQPSRLDPPQAGGYFLPHVRPKTWFIVPGVDAQGMWIANRSMEKGVVENVD